MPLSNPDHISTVLHFAQACRPKSILDVGIGTGSYGLLLRQSLDIGYGRVQPAEWQVEITGVEIFENYHNPVWDYAYTSVILGDVRQILPKLKNYDLVLCNDVLEHFPREEARTIAKALVCHCGTLIATTPNREYPQGAWGGNEAETHHSLLDRTDFTGLVAEIETGITTCYICTTKQEMVYPLLITSDRCARLTPAKPQSLFVRIRRKWRQWRLTRP